MEVKRSSCVCVMASGSRRRHLYAGKLNGTSVISPVLPFVARVQRSTGRATGRPGEQEAGAVRSDQCLRCENMNGKGEKCRQINGRRTGCRGGTEKGQGKFGKQLSSDSTRFSPSWNRRDVRNIKSRFFTRHTRADRRRLRPA